MRPFSTSISTSVASWPSPACSACQRPEPFMDIASGPHRYVDPAVVGNLDGALVAGVGVAHHAATGIVGQDALQLPRRLFGAVRDHDHAGVDGAADADAAAVVDADPRGAAGRVEQGVED